jgi:tRNA(Ile)-lysidine synthase
VETPLEKVRRFIKLRSLLDGARGVVVAVSGGADSVALLDMLVQLKARVRDWGSRSEETREAVAVKMAGNQSSNPRPLTPIPHLHIAHLNHKLRGRESDQDAEFVRELAEELRLPVTLSAVDVRAAGAKAKLGIEEAAREIRYRFLTTVASETGCDRIAVGHTMTDQAETVLMRLIRGAGLRGFSAMRPVIPAHTFSSAGPEEQGSRGAEEQGGMLARLPSAPLLPGSPALLIIRPLLCITRKEVEAYCHARGLEFRDDATNSSLDYSRNRLRNEVNPVLTAINPRAVEAIARAADNAAGDLDALETVASSLLKKARLDRPVDRLSFGRDRSAYSVAALREQPVGLGRRMIIEAIRVARRSVAREQRDGELTSKHVTAVEALLMPNSSGKRVSLPGRLEVWREFDALVFKPAPQRCEGASYQTAISSKHPTAEACGLRFTLQRGVPGDELVSVIAETQQEKQRAGLDWMIVALDDQAVPEDLVIRPRLEGERALVIGQRRTKKLKNLMIDHRIPISRRANWPLVTTLDGCYIWSPGLPPALKFAARDDTQRVVIMRASSV